MAGTFKSFPFDCTIKSNLRLAGVSFLYSDVINWVIVWQVFTLLFLRFVCSPALHKLGHVTCSGQWDMSRFEANEGFKCACIIGLILLYYYHSS